MVQIVIIIIIIIIIIIMVAIGNIIRHFAITITIIISKSHLRSCRYAIQRDDGKALSAVFELPLGLPWTKVVEHVCIWNQSRRAQSIDHQPEVATAHTHACPGELSQVAHLQKVRTQLTATARPRTVLTMEIEDAW
jgi:hypothetical protein